MDNKAFTDLLERIREEERLRICAELMPCLMKMGDDKIAGEILMKLRHTKAVLMEPAGHQRRPPLTVDEKTAALEAVHTYLLEGSAIGNALVCAARDFGLPRMSLEKLWYDGKHKGLE